MKLHVKFNISNLAVDEEIEGNGAADVTRKAKMAIAARLDFLSGTFVRSMPDLGFAREVVSRYNSATGSSCPPPAGVDEFIDWALAQKLASVVE
ncbi:MAG: hypothetical protein Q7T82_17395 [Armatimonadota bacterium]|nr:hypothetical protein [Armatimonadota bacterium]